MYGESQYGVLTYSENFSIDDFIKSYSPNLMEYLPMYYRNSNLMKNIQNAFSKEIGIINYLIDDILSQLFVDTATWGLDLWEKELGINTDISKTYEHRREIIKAKIRGTGTVTKQMLKNVALAYTNAEVDVIEKPNDSSFIVKFISVKGIPKNIKALIETIETIKPAHLNYSFEYTYSWWDNARNLIWSKVNNYSWNELKGY